MSGAAPTAALPSSSPCVLAPGLPPSLQHGRGAAGLGGAFASAFRQSRLLAAAPAAPQVSPRSPKAQPPLPLVLQDRDFFVLSRVVVFRFIFFLSLSLLFASSLHQLPHLGHISPLLLSTLFQGPAPARRHHLPGTASRAGRCRATRVQRAQLSATAGHHCWIRGTEGALATHREKKNNNSPPSTPQKRKNNQKANKNPLQS